MIKYEYITHEEMNNYYSEVVRQIAKDGVVPEVIIAPMRGGADFGIKLSNYFDVPFVPVVWQTRDGEEKDIQSLVAILDQYWGRTILLVDDICDSGKTLSQMIEIIRAEEVVDFYVAVAIENIESKVKIDYTGREISRSVDEQWFVFPWEDWWKRK
jgi:hypoxanthine phosphoribosyltransferase